LHNWGRSSIVQFMPIELRPQLGKKSQKGTRFRER